MVWMPDMLVASLPSTSGYPQAFIFYYCCCYVVWSGRRDAERLLLKTPAPKTLFAAAYTKREETILAAAGRPTDRLNVYYSLYHSRSLLVTFSRLNDDDNMYINAYAC